MNLLVAALEQAMAPAGGSAVDSSLGIVLRSC